LFSDFYTLSFVRYVGEMNSGGPVSLHEIESEKFIHKYFG